MLLVDAGNTFIKWARPVPHQTFRLESVNWQNFGAVRHHEMAALKQAWHRLHEETPIRHVLISNVAGQQLENTLSGLLETLNPLPESVEWFRSARSLGGITNTYQDYRKLGCDRFASMIGAHALLPGKALVVVTAGTATTIDTLSPDGTFLGGMILPGLKLMADSLAHNTALLPETNQTLRHLPQFADNTSGAILSGCINAQAGAIERAVTAHRKHFSDVHCLLSGGAAPYIAPNLSIPCRIIDNLVLIGLHTSSIRPTY